ncbi:hypothetical protein HA44_08430 [Mixta gaviniae]|nr:hypothetical protein HA44_08430 [Mixta gaviniae]
MANSENGVTPEHTRPRPAHDLLHLFALCRLIAVDWALLTGGLLFAEGAAVKALERIAVQRLISLRIGRRLRAA